MFIIVVLKFVEFSFEVLIMTMTSSYPYVFGSRIHHLLNQRYFLAGQKK